MQKPAPMTSLPWRDAMARRQMASWHGANALRRSARVWWRGCRRCRDGGYRADGRRWGVEVDGDAPQQRDEPLQRAAVGDHDAILSHICAETLNPSDQVCPGLATGRGEADGVRSP